MTEKKPRGRGRPTIGATNMTRRNVHLSDEEWELARCFGDGSAAEGIRRALAELKRRSVTVTEEP